ncbi:MAG TPA: RagB/SusD family nutrient uptake outer membrane protein [Hanamia sp.]|nr:RagB/SusD family nutrient uptake outer membrane protein [Hanamia sp.]
MKHIIQNKSVFKACIFLCCFAVLFSSCKKYLTEKPTTSFSADFVYNTPDGLELGVVALYNLYRSFYEDGEWNSTVPFLLQAKSDLVIGRTGETSLFSILTWGASLSDYGTTRYGFYWDTYYKIIDRANAVIKGAENVQGISEDQRNQILSEAKCFRAQSYFILYRLFNNIFVTTEPTTPENAFNIINNKSPEDSIFGLINSDLDFAISHLSWTTPDFGRFTQATARHIKAKVAMWQQNWQEAKTQSEAVINSGFYSLVPNTKDVFKGDLNNSETLWAIQYESLTFGGGSPNRFNFLSIPQYGAIPGSQYDNSEGGRGAGFLLLNNYLRDLLAQDPNDDRANNSYYISYFTYNDPTTLPPGVNIGDTIRVYNEFSTSASERSNWFARLNPGCRKFSQDDAIPTQASQIKNIMVYRLAETYLIAAEATWRISQNNSDALALQYLNAVRERAHAAPLDTIDQQTILDERGRELAFEGQRWYTLKRMGVMISQMQQYAGYGAPGIDPPAFPVPRQVQARTRIQPYMVNWPIPVAEIRLLGPNYPQNEGY